MAFTLQDFSRTATTDLRSAMAEALADYLRDTLVFDAGAGVRKLERVFDDWPSYLDRYVPPSACVLPGAWVYSDPYLVPSLMEDTWEPQQDGKPTGERGFGLYKVAEMDVTLEASFRTNTTEERKAILLAGESLFRDPDLLMNEAKGARNAVLLEMPQYYGVCARFALVGGRVIDDEDRAMRENRDAVLTIKAEATQVVVGPVAPLNVTVRQIVGPEVDVQNC